MGIDSNIDEKTGALTSDSNPLKRRGKMPAQDERGTTLVEVAVAGALLVFALASLYALYGTTVKEAKTGDTAAIAEQNSIARIISIYPAAVPQTSPLPAPTPSPSPTPGSTPFFSVTKIDTGIPAISPSAPSSILGEKLIRVEVTTEWVTSATTHQRQLSTLISKSGTKTR